MTIQDLKNGTPFKFKGGQYKLEEIQEDRWIVSRADMFNDYVAAVETIDNKSIKCFTFVLGKEIRVIINIDECNEVTE